MDNDNIIGVEEMRRDYNKYTIEFPFQSHFSSSSEMKVDEVLHLAHQKSGPRQWCKNLWEPSKTRECILPFSLTTH